jgi:hypothetical protein
MISEVALFLIDTYLISLLMAPDFEASQVFFICFSFLYVKIQENYELREVKFLCNVIGYR